jgi:hypothetical protein
LIAAAVASAVTTASRNGQGRNDYQDTGSPHGAPLSPKMETFPRSCVLDDLSDRDLSHFINCVGNTPQVLCGT